MSEQDRSGISGADASDDVYADDDALRQASWDHAS